jgi:putative DNA primase/helicase
MPIDSEQRGEIVEIYRPGHADATGPRSDLRPIIRLVAGAYKAIAEDIEAAMIKAGLPIFRRANRLVFPVVRNVEGANGVMTKAAQLEEIGTELMRQFMELAVRRFERFDVKSNKWMPTKPPEDIARLELARVADWPFPEIAGVIVTPTIDRRGRLVDVEGFDPSTGLFLAHLPLMPVIPEQPTKEDAEQALKELKSLLGEFVFVDEASRSVALSGLITPVCRGAIPLAPMHSASAPEASSGKSLLWDTASAIATGRACPVVSAGRTVEELEKRLAAIMLKGQPIVSIDNVNGTLSSDLLCQILERPRVEIRLFGTLKSPDVECRTTWMCTGNNLRVVGDLNRRNLTTRMDTDVERPELRTFAGNPVATVMRERGRYIAACLTIVRAYIVAGMPEKKDPLASYREWSDMIRSALAWLGQHDPVETMQSMRENDPTLEQRRMMWAAWPGATEYTAADLIKLATPVAGEQSYGNTTAGKELREALLAVAAGKSGDVNPTRLGCWLRDNQDKQLEGRKLIRVGKDRTNKVLWAILSPMQKK